jgi:hypothetical protein
MYTEAVPIDFSQWPYPELEAQLGDKIRSLLHEAEAANSVVLDRLEGISVVENLAVALKNFDAGYPSDHGAAMRDTVLGRMITTRRADRVRGHIFLPVDAALQIANKDAPLHKMCAYMFTHECAHVQDLETRSKSLTTEDLLDPPLSQPIALSLQIVWNEYAACRLSAFSYPDQVGDFQEALRQSVTALVASREKVKAVFAPTPEGRQLALSIALDLALPVMQAFSYLFGHCRGIAKIPAEHVPQNYLTLITDQTTSEAFSRMEQQLDRLWDSRDRWDGYRAFDDLVIAICLLIRALTGIVIAPRENRAMAIGFVA